MISMKPMIVLGTVTVLGLSACTSTPLQNAGPRTKNGALTGAVIGGLLGATRKGDGKLGKAAVGAAIGGIVGGAIGSQLDKQAGDLQQSLNNDQVKIVNTGSSLVVTMPQDILFAVDSADVNASLRNDLGALARNLQQYPNSGVQVIGHTDNEGDADYNLSLSRSRAAAVAGVLFQNGVAAHRVITIGRGEDAPIASNLTPEGRQQNRRVEIIITPNA